MTLFTPSDTTLNTVILLLPESSLMSLASTLDMMRATNRIANRCLFNWKIVTLDGKPANLSCGLPITPTSSLNKALSGDILFIIAGFHHQKYLTKDSLSLIKQASRQFKTIGGIEAGSWILGRCGLLNGKVATTHWEDHEEFVSQFPKVMLKLDRFVIDGSVFTTSGALPTVDFILHLIKVRYGYPLALEVSSTFIYDDTHSATDTQTLVSLRQLANFEPRVASAIELMSQHIDETLTMSEIAKQLQLSTRMLEYLFIQVLNTSPGAYYRRLRLQSALRLVVDTRLNFTEIAIRTGFNSLPSFCRLFKKVYQQSPGKYRQQLVEK